MTVMSSPDPGGTYGLHSTSWANVKKALRILGGHEHRTTKNHDSVLYKMPSGYTIAVGKAKAHNDQIAATALQQVMQQVVTARIEPYLFLATLDRIGCAWAKRPPDVANLARWLRSRKQYNLRTEALQRTALRDFARATAAPEDAPSDEKGTPYEAEKAQERANAPDPGPSGTGSDVFTFTTADVLDLTGLTGDARTKASMYASGSMNSRSGVAGRLQREKQAARLPRPKGVKGSGVLNAFTERGAMTFAQELLRRYGEPGDHLAAPDAPAPAAPEAEQATPPAEEPTPATPPQDEPAPAKEPAAGAKSTSATTRGHATAKPPAPRDEPKPKRGRLVDRTRKPIEPPTGGAALLALCRHHDTDPVFIANTFTLDTTATIERIAAAITTAGATA